MKNNLRKIVRILSIIFCGFISVFAMDTLGENFSFIALIMNLIPTFLAIIMTIISWKWEFWGGILWLITGVLVMLTTKIDLVITLPIIIIGGLNILSAKLNKK